MITLELNISMIILSGFALLNCLGGALGFYAFLDWRRKKYFLEFINRKISKGGNNDA